MSSDCVLELKGVAVSFKKVNSFFSRPSKVLKGIDLKLVKGETLGVCGPNGAGTSTLLSVMAGVIQPDSGSVHRYSKKTALLSLNLGMDSRLSGRRNAFLHGMMLGFTYEKVQSCMDGILDYSGLERVIDDPLYTYSSGMRARLGFSVAYHLEADVLLVDEMLGVGDKEFRRKTSRDIKNKLVSDQTVVLVTHNLKVLKELSDRILCLESGEVASIISPEELSE